MVKKRSRRKPYANHNAEWEEAVQQASGVDRARQNPDDSIHYLRKLVVALESRTKHWDRPMQYRPPPMIAADTGAFIDDPAASDELSLGSNAFSVLMNDDSEHNNSSDEADNISTRGERVDTTRIASGSVGKTSSSQPQMATTDDRISESTSHFKAAAAQVYFACLTALGEMLGVAALQRGREKKWNAGAVLYVEGHSLLMKALVLADHVLANILDLQQRLNEYAQCQSDATMIQLELKALETPCRILTERCEAIALAAQHSGSQLEKFQILARKRKLALQQELEPQWSDRDAAKARMGADRWTNNPNATGWFAQRRAAAEQEYKEIIDALERLQTVNFSNVEHLSRMRIANLQHSRKSDDCSGTDHTGGGNSSRIVSSRSATTNSKGRPRSQPHDSDTESQSVRSLSSLSSQNSSSAHSSASSSAAVADASLLPYQMIHAPALAARAHHRNFIDPRFVQEQIIVSSSFGGQDQHHSSGHTMPTRRHNHQG